MRWPSAWVIIVRSSTVFIMPSLSLSKLVKTRFISSSVSRLTAARGASVTRASSGRRCHSRGVSTLQKTPP